MRSDRKWLSEGEAHTIGTTTSEVWQEREPMPNHFVEPPKKKADPEALFRLYSQEATSLEKKLNGSTPRNNGGVKSPEAVRQARRKARYDDLKGRLIPQVAEQLNH